MSTESMDESDVYKDLGATITDKDEYDWSFYINGVEQKTGTIPGKERRRRVGLHRRGHRHRDLCQRC